MKTLDDLDAIEQITDSKTLKKSFVQLNNKVKISQRNITLLNYPPVLLTKSYEGFKKIESGKIPEEADAFLLGQKILVMGETPREIYPASYCKFKKR